MSLRNWTLATATLALFAAHDAFAAPGLDVRLDAVADKAAAGTGQLHYALHNGSDLDLLVLAWETPLRGVQDDLFEVRQNGKAVDYVGRHYKRGLPMAQDYIEIKAGATLSVDVDLTAYYDMRAGGNFDAQFVGHFHDSFSVKAARANVDESLLPVADADLRSNVTALYIDAYQSAYPSETLGVLNLTKAGSVSFVGCSSTQSNNATTGHSAAQSYAGGASSYLATGAAGPRYTTWFGTYSSNNYTTLKSNFSKIGSALNTQAVTYHCDCASDMSTYAYVYTNQPYNIHLCGAYFAANNTGTDSRGGTIIHETSHFTVVAGTGDLAYGQTACKKLASNPKRAIKNADSHEYFAENTPTLN